MESEYIHCEKQEQWDSIISETKSSIISNTWLFYEDKSVLKSDGESYCNIDYCKNNNIKVCSYSEWIQKKTPIEKGEWIIAVTPENTDGCNLEKGHLYYVKAKPFPTYISCSYSKDSEHISGGDIYLKDVRRARVDEIPDNIKPIEPKLSEYIKLEVVKDIIRSEIGVKGSLPWVIPKGYKTWTHKAERNNLKFLIEDNRWSATIPKEYFKIIEESQPKVEEWKPKVGDWVVVEKPCSSSYNKKGYVRKITEIKEDCSLSDFGRCTGYLVNGWYEHISGLRKAEYHEIQSYLPGDHPDKKKELILGEYQIGDIVVSTVDVRPSRKIGDIFKVLEKSYSKALYYERYTCSSEKDSWRLATDFERDAYNSGIKNVNDILKNVIETATKYRFKEGQHVVINEKSEYKFQGFKDGKFFKGTVIKLLDEGDYLYRVKWEDNSENSYRNEDLLPYDPFLKDIKYIICYDPVKSEKQIFNEKEYLSKEFNKPFILNKKVKQKQKQKLKL